MEIAKFWSTRKAGGLFPLAWGPGRQETVFRHLLVSCPHGRLLHGLAHLQGGEGDGEPVGGADLQVSPGELLGAGELPPRAEDPPGDVQGGERARAIGSS